MRHTNGTSYLEKLSLFITRVPKATVPVEHIQRTLHFLPSTNIHRDWDRD